MVLGRRERCVVSAHGREPGVSNTLEFQANTLLADQFFSPSLFLAERIERGVLAANGLSGRLHPIFIRWIDPLTIRSSSRTRVWGGIAIAPSQHLAFPEDAQVCSNHGLPRR